MKGIFFMQPTRTVPNNPETMTTIRQIAQAPWNEKPMVEMTDESSRDMQIIWSSIQACRVHWRGEHELRIPGYPQDRTALWCTFAKERNFVCIPMINEFVLQNSGSGKLAIELGCGNTPNIKALIQKGWRVTAIDSSQQALNILASQYKKEIDSGILKVIHADATAYIPDEPADLVIAEDVLPYVDPSKFQNFWIKIHKLFVKENGLFIGSFFRTVTDNVMQMNMMREMGAWFLPDRRMVRPLLTNQGFEVLKCTFRKDDQGEPICIQFAAKKISIQ